MSMRNRPPLQTVPKDMESLAKRSGLALYSPDKECTGYREFRLAHFLRLKSIMFVIRLVLSFSMLSSLSGFTSSFFLQYFITSAREGTISSRKVVEKGGQS